MKGFELAKFISKKPQDAKFTLEHAVIKTFLVYIHVVATQFGLLG